MEVLFSEGLGRDGIRMLILRLTIILKFRVFIIRTIRKVERWVGMCT